MAGEDFLAAKACGAVVRIAVVEQLSALDVFEGNNILPLTPLSVEGTCQESHGHAGDHAVLAFNGESWHRYTWAGTGADIRSEHGLPYVGAPH